MRFATHVIASVLLCTAAAARAADAPPDLAGAWLVDSASNAYPDRVMRSQLTLTDHTFSLSGYFGMAKPGTGTFTLGPDGALDLHVDSFDLSGNGIPIATLSGDIRALYKFEPSPGGDRLTLCIPEHFDVPRPTTFTAADDVEVLSFVRVGKTFPEWPTEVTVTVLDPAGKPAVGARIFNYADCHHREIPVPNSNGGFTIDMSSPATWHYREVATTGPDGTAKLPYEAFCEQPAAPNAAYAPASDHPLMGIAHVSPAALRNGTLKIQLQPTRRVHGTITSASDSIVKDGVRLPFRAAFLFSSDSNRMFFANEMDGQFNFILPPGTYDMYAYGTNLKEKPRTITVPPGTEDIVLPPITLEPIKLPSLIGHPPPPLRGVRAWKGESVDLSSLKGKVVLLDFWGYWCGNCVVEMPQVMRVAQKYKDRGLAVVGVHVDFGDGIDTVAKLDAKTERYRTGIWHGQDLPFPVALVERANGADARYCEAADDFGVPYFPCTIVIGRDGLVSKQLEFIFATIDDKQIDAAIEKLLDAKPTTQPAN